MILFKNENRTWPQWPNFTERELYSKSPDKPPAHQLVNEVIDGVQIIRTWLGRPVIINSTYRTKKHNDSLGSNDRSQHRISTAIDFKAKYKEDLEKVKKELRSRKGPLWEKLRNAGVQGFGIYGSFIHIDARKEAGKNKDQFGNYAFWDMEKKTLDSKKKSIDEDGDSYREPQFTIYRIVLFVAIAAFIYFNYKLIKNDKRS